MFVKNSVRSQQSHFVKNSQLFTITFLLLAFLVWNAQPVDAIVGAVEDGLVAYWSFNKDTVKIKTEAADVLSGLVAAVHGDPELAPSADCKVGECILFDGCDCDTIQGYIDEFRIYDRALTAAEVQNNMNATGLDVNPSVNHLSVTWGHIKARRR